MTSPGTKSRILLYLASPYSHTDARVREARFIAACEAVAWLMRRDVLAFSPIAHTHPVVVQDPELGWDYNAWRALDEEMIRRCDEVTVLMLDGWLESKGVQAEVAFARSIGKPINYLDIWFEDGKCKIAARAGTL